MIVGRTVCIGNWSLSEVDLYPKARAMIDNRLERFGRAVPNLASSGAHRDERRSYHSEVALVS